jgi:activator of Hsp90 ATPase-like protein
VTITFRAIGQKTEMTLHQDRFATKESLDSHHQGWSGLFDNFTALTEIVLFSATRVRGRQLFAHIVYPSL